MKSAPFRRPLHHGCFLFSSVLLTIALFLTPAGLAQARAQSAPQISPEDLKKYTAFLSHLGGLLEKMHAQMKYPPPRSQSRLLPLLPESTIVYAAVPNYGELSHQALTVFQQELKDNSDLRSWWQQGEMTTEGPKIVDGAEKFYQLSQYLGDELVFSAASEGKKEPSFLVLAEVTKPGLKDFLQQMLKDPTGKSKPAARVFDVTELAAAREIPSSDQPVILVRPDLVVGAANLATLRGFNAHLEESGQHFAATEFGQRLTQGYEGGATLLAGIDLHAILKQNAPDTPQSASMLQLTGFSDMKYLIWEHNVVEGQSASQMELSFTGPRRGVASWLVAPGSLDGLDFVSPDAMLAVSVLLKNPAEIFDDVKEIATGSNPNAFASLDRAEQQLKLSLRDDVFGRLDGEITIEMDRLTPPNPAWKILLKTHDTAGLLATLNGVLNANGNAPTESNVDGISCYTLVVPAGPKLQEVTYAAADGYLMIGSSRDALAEGVSLHRSGGSLAKSSKLQSSLPPGRLALMSALFYEDAAAMAGLWVRQLSPELAESLSKANANSPAVVIAAYGDENAVREASRSGGADVSAALIVGAIAIPNLLRARIAANEASAVSSIRTVNVAQITYASTYPQRGFARDLASLGPRPDGINTPSPQHAGFVDSTLAKATCTAGTWCIKDGYRFRIVATCRPQQPCLDFVVVATPVSANIGTRNFCSTSDAVVRFQVAPPLSAAVTAKECKSWAPLQQ